MITYTVRRLFAAIFTTWATGSLVFALIRLVPGDVIQSMLGVSSQVSQEAINNLKAFFGLDKPIYIQYFHWLGDVLSGNFGQSFRSQVPVIQLVFDRFPVSGELAVLSMLIALAIGIPLGTLAAIYRKTPFDGMIRVFATFGLSIPAYWQGIVFILIFSVYFDWMPSVNWIPFTSDPVGNLKILALPAITLGTVSSAMITRLTRSTMLEVLSENYIQTARAKGLTERVVNLRHGLKNALIPVLTVAGIQLGYILGGLVVIEQVFNLPGMGRLLLNAIFQRDYPVVQGTVLFFAFSFAFINLTVDLLYGILDPRIKYD